MKKTTKLMEFELIDGVVVARYNSTKTVTASIAEQIVRERKDFTKNKPCRLVVVFPKLQAMDKGGRDYLSSDDAKENVLAGAIVAQSILGRVIVNFFLKLNNNNHNDFPQKLFNNEAEALTWINDLVLDDE